jgi:hypothetical protein
MEMGFDREQVVVCLNASDYNTEIAVNYLFNGIPEQVNPV